MHHPTDRIAHTTAFVTPVMEHWLEREIAEWVSIEEDLRSGQIRSECLMCTFRASCCSARLSWVQVSAFTGSSVQDNKNIRGGEGVRGDHLHWWLQGSTSSPTGIGSRRRVVWGVMEFGLSRRIKSKEKYVHISIKEIFAQFGRSA